MRSVKICGFLCVLGGALLEIGSSFVPAAKPAFWTAAASRSQVFQRKSTPIIATLSPSTTALSLGPDGQLHTLLVATIDSDISKMSDNEFAPVFIGGILVMLGGLLSAIFVGVVVDKKDLYSQIVADSYLQGADDEAFWKGLSEEEKRKTQEMLAKIKSTKQDSIAAPVKVESRSTVRSEKADLTPPAPSEEKAIGMFSDYGEDA